MLEVPPLFKGKKGVKGTPFVVTLHGVIHTVNITWVKESLFYHINYRYIK